MSFLDKFEQSSEKMFNKIFSRFSGKELKPVELVTALKKEVDSKIVSISLDKKIVPSQYHIILSTADFDTVESWGSNNFADELAMEISEYATSQGYTFTSPVKVIFEENVELEKGNFKIMSPKVSQDEHVVISSPSSEYMIDVNGRRYPLSKSITTVGRSQDADIVIDDTSVSRKHIQFKITPEGVIVKDLGSTNGMRVEDHLTADALLLNGNTITIGRSKIIFWSK
ncbi:MAG: DUF3662 and FHA domain-containing protein [Bifidobacteriaceae bacterium]|jgi:hypothetical protein|nr:DUF3662 and FHA domain-containing protein [Bifidobacteriaceae bacterium]